MTTISLDQIEIGMVIVADVRDRSGRLLLRAESPVTEARLSVLKTWGIKEVKVAPQEGTAEAETKSSTALSERHLRTARKQVGQRFKLTNQNHIAMATLLEFCIERHARKLQKGSGD